MELESSDRDNFNAKEKCDAGIAVLMYLLSWVYYSTYRDNIQVLFFFFQFLFNITCLTFLWGQ